MSADDDLRPIDLALLRAIADTGSVAAAARRLGIGRDRAVYRLDRFRSVTGGAAVQSRRGGRGHGASRLTSRARRVLVARSTPAPTAAVTRVRGRFEGGPEPVIRLPDGQRLYVGFRARPGAMVEAMVPAESIVLAPRPIATSARNRLSARVARLSPKGPGLLLAELQAAGTRWTVALTAASVHALRLAPGRRCYLLVKATAARRVAAPVTPGSHRW